VICKQQLPLEDLADALWDFNSIDNLQAWLGQEALGDVLSEGRGNNVSY
jgi:hypothetical protein